MLSERLYTEIAPGGSDETAQGLIEVAPVGSVVAVVTLGIATPYLLLRY